MDKITRADRPFQTHRETTLTGSYKSETVTFPAGTFVIRSAQPLGLLASYLLEPESDDGLTTWNFFDSLIATGQPHPVFKSTGSFSSSSKILNAYIPSTQPAR